jgi:L-fucose isomerase-like protein
MDKMASLYIHILPNILFYCSETNKLNFSDYLSAIGFYIGWQYFYIIVTEIVNKTELDNDKELSTSLRWMASNYKKNKMANTILYFCKKWGICNEFDSNDIKTKIIFMTCQFIIMLLSLIVPFIISKAKEYHLIYIVIIFMAALYNGAV